ncbi:MAG: dihydrodipicolinate synthase family protein [Kiritimatiellae bacterium]|nr:dihydrodipicolinate synthase family protein [Kiritimatiellia bacterium]
MKRRDFLMLGAAAAAAGCSTTTERRGTAVARRPGGGDPRMRGPFPIMTTPYNSDGSVDYESLAREAVFVADSGCPGVIWCQSGDAVDLLSYDEKVKGYETLARTLQGRSIMLTLGCNGKNAELMLREARAVEEVAARFPRTQIAIISRPPDSGKTQDDIRDYYEKLAAVAKRPVIIQTYVNKTCPAPEVKLLVDLARRHPKTFGYIKEESEGDKANERMVEETAAKPVIHTVFSAWGGWQWLYQNRRCGSEGLVSERCAYAPLLTYIWRRMENGDADGTLTQAFALFRLLIDQRGFPGGEMRGYGLYYFMRKGIFKNMLTRQYRKSKAEEQGTVAADGDTSGWKLKEISLTDRQKAELDQCYDDMMRFIS